jgi:hypothetical protein
VGFKGLQKAFGPRKQPETARKPRTNFRAFRLFRTFVFQLFLLSVIKRNSLTAADPVDELFDLGLIEFLAETEKLVVVVAILRKAGILRNASK